MALLLKLNDLRPQVEEIRAEAKETFTGDDKDFEAINNSIDELAATLTQTISLIEKHYSDERTMDKIEKDLRTKLADDPIFEGFSEEQRNQIIEKIISDPDVSLITEEELKEYITGELKSASSTDLITKAYSKDDIINLGDAVAEPGSSELFKYDSGLEVLRNMVETPTGREDALTYGLKRMMSDSATRLNYVNMYYGISDTANSEPETEGIEDDKAT